MGNDRADCIGDRDVLGTIDSRVVGKKLVKKLKS